MRLFIALDLPVTARDALEELQRKLPGGRPVDWENLHLTLSFLGDQPEDTLEALHDNMTTLRNPAISLTLSNPSLFGGKLGQAVALDADGGPDLVQLHDKTRTRVHGTGMATERRRFRPHVTLARLSGRADPGPLLQTITGARLGPYLCQSVTLYASILSESGVIYDPLASYPLTLI